MLRTALIALILLLAGCSSPPDAAEDPDEAFEEFQVAEDELVIKGVVVDQTITPLAGALVVLADGRDMSTTDKGAFLFADVELGFHALTVSKPGYLTSTVQALVDETTDAPTIRVMLQSDPVGLPFHELKSVKGFLECGIGIPGGGSYSACQTPIGASDIACQTTGVCLGYVNAHRGILEISVDAGTPTYAQAEAVWQATSPNSKVLTWSASSRTPDTLEFNNGTRHTGESPVVVQWSEGRLSDQNIGDPEMYVYQVFPEYGGVGNLVLSQKVEMYQVSFYQYMPPEGWLFSVDGEPTPPR